METTRFEVLLSGLSRPRPALLLISLLCLGLLAFGLYLQHVVGLEPCPMCIVQRYVMVILLLLALLFAALPVHAAHTVGVILMLPLASSGAFAAARQSWLQWHPPDVVSCGRDFYGMIETFPLKRAIPMIFRGGGDCSQVDWTFLGLSIANWSFLAFVTLGLYAAWVLQRQETSQPRPAASA